MNYLNTTLVRLALQDFRCFLGQHFPFLGKRHSSSRLMSSRSNFMSKSVTRILSPDRVPSFISITRSTLFPNILPTSQILFRGKTKTQKSCFEREICRVFMVMKVLNTKRFRVVHDDDNKNVNISG